MQVGHTNAIVVIGVVSLNPVALSIHPSRTKPPEAFLNGSTFGICHGGKGIDRPVAGRADSSPKAYLVRGLVCSTGARPRKSSRTTRATHRATGIQYNRCTVPGSDHPNRFHPHWRKSPAAYVSPPYLSRSFSLFSHSFAKRCFEIATLRLPSPLGQQVCYQRRHI